LGSRLLIVSFSVCPAPDRHGVGLLNLIKALASRYTVDVLTLRTPHNELPFVERFMKTRMLRVPIGHGSLASQVESFRRAIHRQLEGEEYDVVHLRSAWGGRAVLADASSKIVYEVARSTEGEPRAADAELAAALAAEEAMCLERADLVLVPTETARAHLKARGLGERVEVVPPGVDVDHFDWEPPPNPAEPFARVLFAGQIAAGRGVRLLATAIGLLRQRRPLRLMLAGAVDETFRPLYEQSLVDTGLPHHEIEALGPIDHDDIPRVIAQATVCVAPGTPDQLARPLAGFPTKLLEYMACRRAVVAPRVPSVQEVLEDGQDGLLFDPGSAEDLARAVGQLLDDTELRDALAESGYRRVRSAYPASATRRRVLESYARLVPGAAAAPLRAASPLDGLPAHPDTTARRAAPRLELASTAPPPLEVVLEAIDYAEAGERRDEVVTSISRALRTRRTSE
jgi:glycosyltransferase involved in cell wall biosynthesis